MARVFDVPNQFSSSRIAALKRAREEADPQKLDARPAIIDCGPVRFLLARHFGFCFGVENAIEIAYRAVAENPGKRVFLLSEVIHNQRVNDDLRAHGVTFLQDRTGLPLIPLEELSANDIVIIPAFGTTVELQERLKELGVTVTSFDATCPFVQKVWRRAQALGKAGYSIVLHGNRGHEETRATFSHSRLYAPTLILRNEQDALFLAEFIRGRQNLQRFNEYFKDCMSADFDPEKHLQRVGIVNQTTMLATETIALADIVKAALAEVHGESEVSSHFADTTDTLCYATHQNQSAVLSLLNAQADLALVLGGYQSSNTSHLWELCEGKVPTYLIKDADEIVDSACIRHFVPTAKKVLLSTDWLQGGTDDRPVTIAVAAGASCPDSTIQDVLERVLTLVPGSKSFAAAIDAAVAAY